MVEGGKDQKKEPGGGADALRLWVASVDYTSDVSIGPTVLAQTLESLRKVRCNLALPPPDPDGGGGGGLLSLLSSLEEDLVQRSIGPPSRDFLGASLIVPLVSCAVCVFR